MTHSVQDRVNALLERLLLRLLTEEVVPSHGITKDEAAEEVIRADHADDTQREEGDGHTVEDEGLVVDKAEG